jgi:F0F1-type ATP synthase membrane subunit b/b'
VLPSLAVFWVVLIVLLLAFVLGRGFFGPVNRVMREREAAIRSAQELARGAAERAREAAEQFEQRTKAAQADLFREMDENRRRANEKRAEIMAETRRDVDAQLADASARLQAQAAEARVQLEQEADALGEAITERVLGRKAS